MIVLAATLAAALLAPTVAPSGAATNQPPQATPPPAAPKKHRWIDWQVGSLDLPLSLYRDIRWVHDIGLASAQADVQGRPEVRPEGRYSLQALAGTGNSFVGSWDNLGPGIGEPVWTFNLRQLYVQAVPVMGIEGLWGGSEHRARRAHRDHVLRQRQLHRRGPRQRQAAEAAVLDEVSVTAGYLGDMQHAERLQALRPVGRAQLHAGAGRRRSSARTSRSRPTGVKSTASRRCARRLGSRRSSGFPST